MKRTGAMLLAAVLALALAAPAAAEAPQADGWAGWTWSTVLDWLGGWTQGLRGVLAGSTEGEEEPEDNGEEGMEADPGLVLDPTMQLLDGNGTETEAYPEINPLG